MSLSERDEKHFERWLSQIGAENIDHVGEDKEEGPPDFFCDYRGRRIAVEVTIMTPGFIKREKASGMFSLEKRLKSAVEKMNSDETTPNYHVSVEYDTKEDVPPKDGYLERKLEEAFLDNNPISRKKVQLIPKEKRIGRGIVAYLIRASNQGSFGDLHSDKGYILESKLIERIAYCVKDKSDKVIKSVYKGQRMKDYPIRWLVLDDETLHIPKEYLPSDERKSIEREIRRFDGIDQWSKVILVRKLLDPSNERPWWFWAIYENPNHDLLPE